MNRIASKLLVATFCLMVSVSLLGTPGLGLAQLSPQDALKGAAKDSAKEMLGVAKPVEGRTEMLDGAKRMVEGRQVLREHLQRMGKIKEGEGLQGGKMINDGRDMIEEGDKLIQTEKTTEGKKKMLDGASMMVDGKKAMIEDLTRKGMLKAGEPLEGEKIMQDAEKMLKKGETMMLK